MEDIFERVPVIKLTVVNWIKQEFHYFRISLKTETLHVLPVFDIIKKIPI